MNYETIYLTREEARRFLEIADGDTTAVNTPEEDALFRAGLVKEAMIASISLDTNTSTVDMRAVVLSDLGREYYAQYRHQQKRDRQEAFRHWVNAIIAIFGVLAAILGFFI